MFQKWKCCYHSVEILIDMGLNDKNFLLCLTHTLFREAAKSTVHLLSSHPTGAAGLVSWLLYLCIYLFMYVCICPCITHLLVNQVRWLSNSGTVTWTTNFRRVNEEENMPQSVILQALVANKVRNPTYITGQHSTLLEITVHHQPSTYVVWMLRNS